MRYSSVIAAVSALAGFAVAQNNTVIPCCSVPVNTVPEDQRDSWCAAQQNTCIDLCGGDNQIASNGNTCDASTLDYTCSCTNGTDISQSTMALYQQTVPAQMCYFWFDACINATIGSNGEGDRAEQTACRNARASNCGNLTIDESGDTSTASESATSTGASRTSTGASGNQASSTASETAASSSGAAVANFAFGTPALAGGLLAIFGLAL